MRVNEFETKTGSTSGGAIDKQHNAPDFNTTVTAIDANNNPAIVSPGSACPIKTFSYVSSFLKCKFFSISPVFAFNRGNEYSVSSGNARACCVSNVRFALTKRDWMPVENEDARE